MSTIIKLISNVVPITGNFMVDTIIFSIICLISFSIAFGFVGNIFGTFKNNNTNIRSGVHWTIRIGVFVGLTAIGIFIVRFIKMLKNIVWWYWLIVGILLAISLILSIIKHYKGGRKENKS